MELKQITLIISILSVFFIVGRARPSNEDDDSEVRKDENAVEENTQAELVADEAGGGESGASGSGSGSGTEPAPAPPATGTPIPIGDAVNQVCAGFQSCVAQVDAAVCLKQMVTALSSLLPPATTGAPVGGTPCQGGAGAPMPMPVPMPMPMPMPMPQTIPYPVQPSSCGGTYPCGDEESKSKSKKHHDEHKHKED